MTAISLRREQRLILEALRNSPLDLQIVLELYYWECMTAREIGEVLSIPYGTVRSRIRRGKEAIRAWIEKAEVSQAVLESTLTDLEGWARGLRDRSI